MRAIILILTLLSLLFAGICAVMTSTPLQSVAVLLVGAGSLIGAVSKYDLRLGIPALVVSAVGFLYFYTRAMMSPVFDLGLGDLFILLPAAGVYFLYVSGCVSRKQFFWGVVSIVLVLGMLNVMMFYPPLNALRDSILPFAQGDRESGLYNHRNFCSNMLMMVVLISTSVGLWIDGLGWKRWLLFLVASCAILGLVLAPARGGFLGMVVGLVMIAGCYFMLTKLNSKQKILMTSLTVVFGFAVLVGGVILFNQRGENLESSIDVGGRKQYFAMAIDQVPDAPLLGSGSMSHSYMCYKYWAGMHANKGDHVWVHNEFLQTITDYGLVGFMLLLAFIFCCVWAFLVGVRSSSDSSQNIAPAYKLKLIGLAAMVGFLVNACVSFPAHAQPNFLVFAFACAVVILRLNSGELNEGKSKEIISSGVFGQSIIRVIFLVIGVSSVMFGYKEMRALKEFSKHDIYVDNAFWSPANHVDDGWYPALNEVLKVSPNFRRYERLAGLILEKSKSEPDVKVREEMYLRALELSNLSLERHPYYSVALNNKISCLQGLERYAEAMPYHDKLIEQTKYRQLFFEPVNKKLTSLVQWSSKLVQEGDLVQAKEVYAMAYEALYAPIVHPRPIKTEIMSSIVIDRANLLIHLGEDEELEMFWEDFYNQKFNRSVKKLSDSKLLLDHARLVFRYAEKNFLSRKPELAFKWYKKAFWCYNRLDDELMTLEVMDEKDKLAKQIQFLKMADITPAK